MPISAPLDSVSPIRLWSGLIITGLVVLLLAFDAGAKVMEVPQVVRASAGLGLPPGTIVPIGLLLLACTACYAIPRTAVLGAILLTGYLGGAVAIQVRVSAGVFPVVFSTVSGMLVWLGLILREPRLLRLVLWRQW